MPDDAALQDVAPQDAEPEGVPVAHSEQSEQGIQPVDASEQSATVEATVPSRVRRFRDALLNPKAWFASKNRPGIAAFVIPALIIFIAFQVSGVWPSGNRHILTIDLYHQYAPFLAEYQRKLSNFETLMYSWRGGLGTDFLSLFAYYLASPINLLILLFPASQLSNFVLFDVVLKTGLAGYTSYFFLRRGRAHTPWVAVLFSLGYALSSFTLAYFWNIMWLDVQIMLPLLAYGAWLIVKHERLVPYVIFTAITLFVNYYAAFFAVLFIALYFLVLLVENVPFKRWRDQVAKTILFGGASVFGAALASALLIPVYLKLQHTSAYGDAWPDKVDFMYSPIDLLGRQMFLSAPAVREGLPNIYAGTLVLLLIPAYFLTRSISVKVKVANGILLTVMALSLSVNSLNFFWHGMHYPNQLNHRFAFTAVFLLVVMAADAFRALKTEPLPLAKIASGIGLLALVMYRIDKEAVTARSMVATIAVSALYVAVLAAVSRREEITLKLRKSPRVFAARSVAVATMIGLVSMELLASSIVGIKDVRDGQVFGNRDGYAAGDFPRDVREVAAKIKTDNDGYPRAELANRKTYNDAFLYGYDGVTLFGSSFSQAQLKLMEDVGLSTNGINSYAYNPAKPLDTFLGVKYVMVSDKERGQLIDYPTYYESTSLNVYENADALPNAFLVDSAAKDFKTGAEGFLTNQARMYEAAFGTSGLYETVKAEFSATTGTVSEQSNEPFGQQVKIESSSGQAVANVRVTAQKDGHYFLAYKSGTVKVQNVSVYTGNEQKVQVSTQKNGLVDLGVLHAGDTGRVEFKTEKDKSGTVSFEAGVMNDSVYESAVAKAKATPVKIERGGRSMDLSINAPQAGYLLVSNIYDPGWEATVNGQNVKIEPFDDSLMLIPVQAGDNQVHMSFTPIGLRAGQLTSALALLLLIALTVFERKTRQRQLKRKHEREIAKSDLPQDEPTLAEAGELNEETLDADEMYDGGVEDE